jgi:hypothetical protein
VYGAFYRRGNPPHRVSDFFAEAPDAFLCRVPKGSFAFGDAIARYRDHFQAAGAHAGGAELSYPRPSVVARIAARRYAEGKIDSVSTLVPLYLRKTEAEERLSQKPNEGEEPRSRRGKK